MDGYKFIKKYRKLEGDRSETVIAAITGHAKSEFFLKALSLGADHAYSKPISSDQIQFLML